MIDILLVVVILVYTAHGVSRGFVQTGMTLMGAVLGLYVGVLVGPWAMEHFSSRLSKQVIAMMALVFSMVIIALLGSSVGAAVRRRMPGRVLGLFDRISGGIVALLITVLVLWGTLGILRSGSIYAANREIDQSKIYAAMQEHIPIDASALTLKFRVQLKEFGSPLAFVGNELIVPVQKPLSDFSKAVQDTSLASTVRVEGFGAACTSGQAGSGWVVAPHRIMTNAHVVAGLDSARVQVAGVGNPLEGKVVYFDAKTDVAILAVPDLKAPALQIGPELQSNDEGLMAGFPFDGPYNEQSLRVRSLQSAPGLDVYDRTSVDRDVYSLRGLVRSGNSGGPIYDHSGRVVGMVFARSAIDADTGYALRPSEFEHLQARAAGLTTPVLTGSCIAGH